ncbi:MAG: FKBP-type peptidyl-prolyl cis-trans isomerase [Spirochaetes bacterium]|nr:FKBP-type peptidyl-prolyl cis-trans isomerase [Spirochaetota bacterium]
MKDSNMGKKITIHYTLKVKNGDVIKSTRDGDPVKMMLGSGELLGRIEDEIATMKMGERKSIELPSAEAFGHYNSDLRITLPADKFPDGVQIGKEYILQLNESEDLPVSVIDISKDKVTVDGNHPLAGKDLIFDVELLEVA